MTCNAAAGPTIGIVLFPGFEALDVFGPVEFLKHLGVSQPLTLITVGPTTGPIVDYRSMASRSLVAEYTFATAPHIDTLLVPGGLGIQAMADAGDTAVQDFIRERYPSLACLLGVGNGAILAAKSGVLDGRKATTNKGFWDWAVKAGPRVLWQPEAMWVEDGNAWTSSGDGSAGMDMAYRFVRHHWSPAIAEGVCRALEYAPHTD